MKTSEELAFYGRLIAQMFGRSYDLFKLPGPRGYFGVGNIPHVMRPDYHVQVLEWANEYGGMYRFCLGQQYIVVLTDPELITQVLGRGEGAAPRKSCAYQFFDLATNHLGRHSFFTTSDEVQWAALRKAAAPAFSVANVKRAFPSTLKFAEQVADVVTAHGPTAAVEIQHHLELLLLNVFVEALFGIPPEEFPGDDVAAAMNLVLEEANERLKVPLRQFYMSWVHPQEERAVRKAQVLLGEAYGRMVDIMRSRGTPDDSDTSLAACLARMRHPKTGKPMAKEELIPEIGALMMAGFDTSSHTVAWCLYTISAHPEVQSRVHSELAAAGLLHGHGCEPRAAQYEDLFKLPYLNAVIDETMRMYPVAATASVRELTQPTQVGQYLLPAGVIVWPMLYALHNSRHNWCNPAPEVFEPSRWLPTGSPLPPLLQPLQMAAAAAAQEAWAPPVGGLTGTPSMERAASYFSSHPVHSDSEGSTSYEGDDSDDALAVADVVHGSGKGGEKTGGKWADDVLSTVAARPALHVRSEGMMKGAVKLLCAEAVPSPKPVGFAGGHRTRFSVAGASASEIAEITVSDAAAAARSGGGAAASADDGGYASLTAATAAAVEARSGKGGDNAGSSGRIPTDSAASSPTSSRRRSKETGEVSPPGSLAAVVEMPVSAAAAVTPGGGEERAGATAVGGGGRSAATGGRKTFLPFSDGIKSCLGQSLGLMEVRTVLVALLTRFHFELDPTMGGPQAVRDSMIMSLTLKMKGGLKLLGTPLEQWQLQQAQAGSV